MEFWWVYGQVKEIVLAISWWIFSIEDAVLYFLWSDGFHSRSLPVFRITGHLANFFIYEKSPSRQKTTFHLFFYQSASTLRSSQQLKAVSITNNICHQPLNPHNWTALRCRSFTLRTQSKRYRKASPWSLFCVNQKNRCLRLQAILCQYWYWIPTHRSNHEVFNRYCVCVWYVGPLKQGVEGLPWWSNG